MKSIKFKRLYSYLCAQCGKRRYTRKYLRWTNEKCTLCQKIIVNENQLALPTNTQIVESKVTKTPTGAVFS